MLNGWVFFIDIQDWYYFKLITKEHYKKLTVVSNKLSSLKELKEKARGLPNDGSFLAFSINVRKG